MSTKTHIFSNKGFTLIELIVVFTVIAILSTIGTASLVSYSRTQSLNQATNDLVQALNSAKTFSASQIKVLNINGKTYSQCQNPAQSYTLSGYGVKILSQHSYALYIACINNNGIVADYPANLSDPTNGTFVALPSDVSFDSTSTNITDIFFPVLSGGVTVTGIGNAIVLKSNYNISPKTISIAQGIISVK